MTTNDDRLIEPAVVGTLMGRYPYRLDPKRRVTIPATLRNRMGNPQQVVVMLDLARLNCLNLFLEHEIEARMEPLRSAALTNVRAANFLTWAGSITETLDVDNQGRIRIRDNLLDRIGVKRDIIMIGALTRVQVWAAENVPSEQEAFDNIIGAAEELNF